MKKFKSLIAVILIAVSMLALTSCIDMNVNVKIDAMNGGKISTVAEMTKSNYEQLIELDEFKEALLSRDVERETFVKDDIEYVRLTEEIECDTHEELSKTLVKKVDHLAKFDIEINDEKERLNIRGEFSFESDLSDYDSYILRVEMPGEVRNIKGCAVKSEENDEVFIIDLIALDKALSEDPDATDATFYVSSRLISFHWIMPTVIASVCGLAVITIATIVIVAVVKKKKRKKAHELIFQ